MSIDPALKPEKSNSHKDSASDNSTQSRSNHTHDNHGPVALDNHGEASGVGGPEKDMTSPASSEAVENVVVQEVAEQTDQSLTKRVKTLLIGRARDLTDKRVFHSVSLAAFLAWVGLGADGLSSSCYGPSEAFHHLLHTSTGSHTYLAIFLSLATILTVFIISACYSFIIEQFPSGGGGYLVASKLLGSTPGVISGSALLVDYVLTVTVSIAAAGDALFGLAPPAWAPYKIWVEAAAILLLVVLNLRGIKESVTFLLPIFLVFLFTHLILLTGCFALHAQDSAAAASEVVQNVRNSLNNPSIGFLGLFTVFIYAYSMGAGTYTGIEAVSNSMPVMREPKVATARRTMLYMALSLAFTAGGLMTVYLLLHIHPVDGKTMNQVLTEAFVRDVGLGQSGLGPIFLWVTIISEGLLLFVAAQAGFMDGPRVLANMAHDSYLPHWFGNLSDRLSTHHGILLMGISAIAALFYTGGAVSTLVTMYSINVFLTFTLSMVGMTIYWLKHKEQDAKWKLRLPLFAFGALLCGSILVVTIYEKFLLGGWVTIVVTGAVVIVCLLTRRYYSKVSQKVERLNKALMELPTLSEELTTSEPDPKLPTAIVLVGGYSGLGVHTMMSALKFIPHHYKNAVFLSVGVVDSGNFKGEEAMEELRVHTEESLHRYVDLANKIGYPSTSFMAIGTDPVEELEHLCVDVIKRFPKSTVFAGQLHFGRESIYQWLFHNQTAYALQRRLQWDGVPMVILPTRVR